MSATAMTAMASICLGAVLETMRFLSGEMINLKGT
jgi:hypothetical protein